MEYVIDGYNVVHHPLFGQIKRYHSDPRLTLVESLRIERLTGSQRNKIIVVFDGYPDSSGGGYDESYARIVFSRQHTADERIIEIVERSPNPKNTVVVSDDKEIRFFIKQAGAKALSVEEFLNPIFVKLNRAGPGGKKQESDPLGRELTYSQKHKINQELRKLWLK